MAFTILKAFSKASPTQIKTVDGGGTANATTGTIVLDALLQEDFESSAEATTHPVELGADITDHIILRPNKLSIQGTVTSTPFSTAGLVGGVASSVAASIGSGLGASLGNVAKSVGGVAGSVGGGLAGKSLAGLLGQDQDRKLEDVISAFQSIRDSKKRVTIQTGLKLYTNYILLNFKVTRNQSSGGSISVSLSLQEIITVASQTALVNIPIPKQKNALANQNKGRVGATAVAKTEPYRSMLKSGTIKIGSLFGGG